jgi:hypothetical protein
MSFIKDRSKLAVAVIIIAYASTNINIAYADKDAASPVLYEAEYISEEILKVPQIPWDIIGAYTARVIGTEKFIKPAQGCERAKEKDDDYLLQLELCKEERKGWLKI